MEKTKDGYLIPETEEEYDEAILNNAGIDRAKIENKTAEEQLEILKKIKRFTPKGYARGGLKLDNYLDNVEIFYEEQPFFYDENCLFWIWDKDNHRYKRTDEITIMNLIDDELKFGGQTVTGKVRSNYLEAFKRVGRKHIPKNPPKNWIQFKKIIVDLKDKNQFSASPNYFMVNSINWDIGKTGKTPIIDKLFHDWQDEDANTLYEIVAYCLLTDYPIHTVFAMVGSGRNGKSQFLKLLENFVGIENITSASLDRIAEERFESAKLYKKLICMMGETNFNVLNKTEQLKKLCSGSDPIDFEFKNKNPFTGHNYAKIIINTNSLPPSNDTTEGFYRRWMVINWNNCFPEGKDIIDTVPEAEYPELAFKCINILSELIERGNFTQQGQIEERKQKYIMASNPISMFLSECCEINDSAYIKAKILYHEYITYLQNKKRRIIKRKEFNQLLAEEGFSAEHCSKKDENGEFESSFFITGLKMKDSSVSSISSVNLHLFPYRGNNVRITEETEEFKRDSSVLEETTFSDVAICILERTAKEIEVDRLISLGVSEKQLEKWKEQGLIYENRHGFVRLL